MTNSSKLLNSNYPLTRDELYAKLKVNNIHGRRYFYPLISSFPTYQSLPSADKRNLSNADKMANVVICLPIYPGLKLEEVKFICELLISYL